MHYLSVSIFISNSVLCITILCICTINGNYKLLKFFLKHGIQDARTYADENEKEEKERGYRPLALYISHSDYIL